MGVRSLLTRIAFTQIGPRAFSPYDNIAMLHLVHRPLLSRYLLWLLYVLVHQPQWTIVSQPLQGRHTVLFMPDFCRTLSTSALHSLPSDTGLVWTVRNHQPGGELRGH